MYSVLWFNLISTLNFIFTFSMHYHTVNITTLYIKKQSQIKIKPRKKLTEIGTGTKYTQPGSDS